MDSRVAPHMMAVDEIAEAVAWRRELHRRPELGYREEATSHFVAERLGAFGLTVARGIAGTGVVGTLSRGTSGRRIALRADMDALPIQEASGVPHASHVPGVMHACGHDGHTAMLLAAARRIAQDPNLDGTVHFIFQPAEEGMGGAKRMVEEGLFVRFPVDAVFALHNWPDLPLGSVHVPDGPVMAAADRFAITFEAVGGHAATPQRTPDTLLAAAFLVGQLNSIVSRRIAPSDTALLSVTQIQGGHSHNVLPERTLIRGTVRSFDAAVQDTIEQNLRTMVAGVALSSGVSAQLDYERYYPATINHTEPACVARRAAQAAGLHVVDVAPSMTSEDFGYMLGVVPGCYAWLGAGLEAGGPGLHSSTYDFNDDALPYGVAYWVGLVDDALRRA